MRKSFVFKMAACLVVVGLALLAADNAAHARGLFKGGKRLFGGGCGSYGGCGQAAPSCDGGCGQAAPSCGGGGCGQAAPSCGGCGGRCGLLKGRCGKRRCGGGGLLKGLCGKRRGCGGAAQGCGGAVYDGGAVNEGAIIHETPCCDGEAGGDDVPDAPPKGDAPEATEASYGQANSVFQFVVFER